MIFPTTVNGIPCQCHVLHHSPAVPMKVYGPGMGDCHPPEHEEFAYELLDRRGRRASWLDRYITPEVDDRLLDTYRGAVKEEDAHIERQAEYYLPY